MPDLRRRAHDRSTLCCSSAPGTVESKERRYQRRVARLGATHMVSNYRGRPKSSIRLNYQSPNQICRQIHPRCSGMTSSNVVPRSVRPWARETRRQGNRRGIFGGRLRWRFHAGVLVLARGCVVARERLGTRALEAEGGAARALLRL